MQLLCCVFDVSTSGYDAWPGAPWARRPSAWAQANATLVQQMRQVHQASKQRYGSPRIQTEWQTLGCRCTQKRVARLMQV